MLLSALLLPKIFRQTTTVQIRRSESIQDLNFRLGWSSKLKYNFAFEVVFLNKQLFISAFLVYYFNCNWKLLPCRKIVSEKKNSEFKLWLKALYYNVVLFSLFFSLLINLIWFRNVYFLEISMDRKKIELKNILWHFTL